MASLLETGHLQGDDRCLDPEHSKWVPIKDFIRRGSVPDYARKQGAEAETPARGSRRQRRGRKPGWFLLAIFAAALTIWGAIFWAGKLSQENAALQTRLELAEATNADLKQKYQSLLFAAREVASNDLVRGKVIIRDATGKRVVLPGIKVRLYPRAEIEAFLSARYSRIAEAGGTDPARLCAHFLKDIPPPIETTATDSDGRFECKVPQPGEYVIQTSIRSAKSGEVRLWFVTFDSRDPLNTPVDITESNVVQQFNPLLMLVEGR
ncbi:MAG: hypothetical protein NTV93_01245 [Verrucomicrobia bacterium]|nr:hypothetical protein [Verrucomicrobiota bacterium]